MDNQHRHIAGYRDLSADEIFLINRVKAQAADVERLLAELRNNASLDHRWLSIATTELQQGFMALTRAIARPGGF